MCVFQPAFLFLNKDTACTTICVFLNQEKDVYTVAVGIGKDIKEETLQQIAGANNPVFIVEDFDELKESISAIKSKACSGEWSEKVAGHSGFL